MVLSILNAVGGGGGQDLKAFDGKKCEAAVRSARVARSSDSQRARFGGRSLFLPRGEIVNESADAAGCGADPGAFLPAGQRADARAGARAAADNQQLFLP